jgi:phospholipid/cholesterol/gamma-HCH transport system substrate-binding protein
VKRAIKNHLGDFLAILGLLVLSVVVAGYVLTHEGLRLPFLSSSQYTLKAEFSTAQAVTPGQGQSIRISGVQVGTVGGVTLNNGVAVVTMNIEKKYEGVVHQNWSALMRPKTGLKDMFIELYPGQGSAPVAKNGYTIPVSNTLPDVNADEILASLDADTRSYLNLLINGAGQGLKPPGGNELAQVLERFEPTHRDVARLNKAVAVRGRDLSQLVNSLQRLNTAMATKQRQIISLVDASSKVFRATASEDNNISRALVLLPGTLSQTTTTLGQVESFAKLLGPTAQKLLPAAAAIPGANAALKALALPNHATGYAGGTAIVRDQIRPFVVAARPFVRQLKPTAINLAKATPNLSKTFVVVNHLENMLGFNPGGAQHGYLWWLAWLDHNARTLFSMQDANGVFRPLFLQASCATWTQLIDNLNTIQSGLGSQFELILNITPIIGATGICPTQATALNADYKKFLAAHPQAASQAAHATSSGMPSGNVSALSTFDPNLPVR